MEYHVEVTINIASNIIIQYRKLNFMCATVSDIQKYLDQDSVIKINDNYPIYDAILIENGVVYEVTEYLQEVYEATVSEILSNDLIKEIVAMLTATEIGYARFGNALGNPATSWAGRLEDRAWRILMRIYISQGLNLPKKNITFTQRLLLSKTRTRLNRVSLQ